VVTADAVSSDATVSAIDFCKFKIQKFYVIWVCFWTEYMGAIIMILFWGVPFYILPI
jgi:hypothetical protein